MACGTVAAATVAVVAVLLAYAHTTSPIPRAQSVTPPPLPTLSPNTVLLTSVHAYQGLVVGPESLALDAETGRLVTGLADGRVVSLRPDGGVDTLARTGNVAESAAAACGQEDMEPECGRPLGIREHPTEAGAFYVADAYKGLLLVRTSGEVETLVSADDHPSLSLCNDVTVDPATGHVYFTNTHDTFQRRTIGWAYLENAPSGSLWRYKPEDGTASNVLDGVVTPNGITTHASGDSLLINAGVRAEVARYWLRDVGEHKAGSVSVFASNLPSLPDNLRASPRGTYWVGGSSKRLAPFSLPQALAPYPNVRRVLAGLVPHAAVYKLIPAYGMVIELDADGSMLRTLQDPSGRSAWLSEGLELNREQALAALGEELVQRLDETGLTPTTTVLVLGSFRNRHLVLQRLS